MQYPVFRIILDEYWYQKQNHRILFVHIGIKTHCNISIALSPIPSILIFLVIKFSCFMAFYFYDESFRSFSGKYFHRFIVRLLNHIYTVFQQNIETRQCFNTISWTTAQLVKRRFSYIQEIYSKNAKTMDK